MKEDINVSRIADGPVILTDRMPGVRSATLGFFFRVGARHEPLELNGISHFIEHTVFKGTRKRTALEIAIEQDRLGGNFDAFTTHEETGFAIKVIDNELPAAFDLIADMLTDPRFDAEDLESEQRVIIEEMKMLEDSPEENLSEIFNREFFLDHSLGLSIAGTPETVRSFDREITKRYHAQQFDRSKLVIAAAGNIQHEQLLELVDKYLPSTRKTGEAHAKPNFLKPSLAAPIVVRQNSNLEQAHLIIAAPLVSGIDERRYAADLLANVIGGGTSSRLWQTIREERGLAYSVGASPVLYQDCGLFSIFAGTSPEQVEEVVKLSIAEMSDVVANGISEDELELAKQQTAASILLGLEDSANRASTLAQSEMVHGRQISVDETLEKFRSVSRGDVQSLASEFFRTENIVFAALGDLPNLTIEREDLAINP